MIGGMWMDQLESHKVVFSKNEPAIFFFAALYKILFTARYTFQWIFKAVAELWFSLSFLWGPSTF